jgi:hypothetical protein
VGPKPSAITKRVPSRVAVLDGLDWGRDESWEGVGGLLDPAMSGTLDPVLTGSAGTIFPSRKGVK